MPGPRAATTVRKTPNFDFVFGRYSHSTCVIPYFQVSMSFSDAAQYLKLVNEMPGAASMNWRIEELFQRDIDWKRVSRKIVPYLQQQNEPQFFNSLTIALLPIRDRRIATYADDGWTPPKLENADSFDTSKPFGPVAAGYYGDWTDPSEDNARIGQLAWNTNEITGIAIDGQHRLAAIKELNDVGSASHVPVILIVLDPALGYRASATRQSLIESLRSLFIDLNKHAQRVSRARQILLDDRDPASICVRALVGDRLLRGRAGLEATPPHLPLTLVDWHSEQAKFDEGPYLTTILGLDWAVAKILGVRPFEDPMAFDSVEKLIGRLSSRFAIDLTEAMARLQDCRRFERPFGFTDEPTNELKEIADGFAREWSQPTLHLLTAFTPYRDLIELRDTHATLTAEFANWYSLSEAADAAGGEGQATTLLNAYEAQLEHRPDEPIATRDYDDALTAFLAHKKQHSLAFTVVFQRALVLAFLNFTKVSLAMTDSLAGDDLTTIDDALDEDLQDGPGQDDLPNASTPTLRAQQLVEALNKLVSADSSFLSISCEFLWDGPDERSDRFWLCSLAQPEGPIDFAQAASQRASDMLFLVALFARYHEEGGISSDGFDALMDRADNAQAGIDLKLQQCLGRMWQNETSIAGRILKSRGKDPTDTDLLWEEIRGRVRWIWGLVTL